MDARIERLAELTVRFGANVQPGQVVAVSATIGQEQFARAIAAAAYDAGAKFVDVQYFDPWVKRARIEHAAEETLAYVPPWYGERVLELGDEHAARIGLAGVVAPGLLDDLDPARVGRDRLPALNEIGQIINDRSTNWCGVPAPSVEWAQLVYPDLDRDDALEKLWEEIGHTLRLDEPDPVAAWEERVKQLNASADRLTERRFDAIQLEGPGTDLTIGLFPSSTFMAADFETAAGIRHLPNLPTEEVFTSPDPERADGVVASTKPLLLADGTMVEGLRVRFEGGRAVSIEADKGAEAVQAIASTDEAAARLGELALVDRAGRIGPLGTVFYTTLLDENAASHIAFGNGFEFVLDDDDRPRRNRSNVHLDFMVGSDEVDVTGITRDGERVPVLRGGDWQI